MSTRVHELAKTLKLTSKELIDKLKTLKIDAKSHMSVLTEEDVKRFKASLAAPSKAAAPAAKPHAAPPPPRQTASIESAKRELLIQRVAATKPATSPSVASAPVKRDASAAFPARKTVVAPAFPKTKQAAVAEPKKHKPVEAVLPPVPRVLGQPLASPAAPVEPKKPKKVEIAIPIVIKEFAEKLSVRPNDLIQKLIRTGIFASMNQTISFESASKVALEFGYELERPKAEAQEPAEKTQPAVSAADKARLVMRAPIVTFMGHVDHGKTSLLDAIRKTKVAASEAGGITQHIGAYEVFLPKGAVTFLDTPGHEAFTAMRARGAKATDVVVLVVAADDGVMPQTLEAIDHAKAAGVPIIVAINKMDLPSANPERVKKALMERGLMPEEWGGKNIMVDVSAKTGKGIDELLEMLVLESELLELRADPSTSARGVVIEAELSKDSGVLATVLVQDGTLHVGEVAVVGPSYCKIRAMINDRGQRIKEAPPSMPVEILGLSSVPRAGDIFYVVKDEHAAKEIVEKKLEALKAKGDRGNAHITLEHLYEDIKAGKAEELKLVIKSDVQGSVEALSATLQKIPSKNVHLNIIHSGVGDISESDVMLAAASNAVVIGFHVGIVGTAKEVAEREEVDVRFYEIIYEVKTSIEKAMEGLLEPETKEIFVGMAEVRQVFKVSKAGMIAGCTVQKGKIVRNFACRVTRGGQKIHEGKVVSLKRFKDDAREVLEGFECGIGVSNFDEILAGDRIEVYELQESARKLE